LTLSKGAQRLLIRTRNSELWENNDGTFRENFTALTRDAAQWVVDRGIRLVGIDYLSIQRYQDDPETHRILMRAGTVIIEGLDLSGVAAGIYELICLPLRLEGAEGSPARVVLRRRKSGA
ncbi:MAG TPA: cyclase family protein, partial [Nitrospiria bacterium]